MSYHSTAPPTRELAPPIPPVHQPLWASLRGAGWDADKLLRWLGYLAPPVDPFWIASRLNVYLLESLDPDADGEWKIGADGNAFVFINTEDLPTRQRFTCAHELGHILLGHPELKRDRISSMGINPFEIAANRYAADLLMPRAWVQAYRRVMPDHTLADVFGVSQAAMNIRLSNTF